jgi:hypothetical protein
VEVHGFPWPGRSIASRKLTMVKLIKRAPTKSTRLNIDEWILFFNSWSILWFGGELSSPQATRVKARAARGTCPMKELPTFVS